MGKPITELTTEERRANAFKQFANGMPLETRQKISQTLKGRSFSPETRKRLSEATKKRRWSDEMKAHFSLIRKGRPSNRLGAKHTEESKLKMGLSHAGVPLSSSHRASLSRALKGIRFSEEHLAAILKASFQRPNRLEKRAAKLLDELFPREYRYVGNGELVIGGRCPDFTNVNGQKKLLEIYGDYWHQGEDPKERIEYFSEFGFDTLVIWEREFDQLPALIGKIKRFHREMHQQDAQNKEIERRTKQARKK